MDNQMLRTNIFYYNAPSVNHSFFTLVHSNHFNQAVSLFNNTDTTELSSAHK